MKPLEVAKGIYWVGAVDWNIRDFHGYSTYLGTTYNSFLIVDDKITLVDAVKKEFTDELLGGSARSWIQKKSIMSSAITRKWTIPAVLQE